MSKGAAISHLICLDKDAPHQDRNLCNNYDQGRLIQQSFYGDIDGTVWQMTAEKRPWRWNPVQGGNYKGEESKVDKVALTKTTFTSTTTPCHWVTGDLLNDCKMHQSITLDQDAAIVRISYKFEYSGTKPHKATYQEAPAMFFWSGLSKLALYSGDAPFKNNALKYIRPLVRPEPVPDHIDASENWASYVDDNDWGVGVWFPHATKVSYYVVDEADATEDTSCSYMAPLKEMGVAAPFVYEYEVVLIIDKLQNIRQKVYQLNAAMQRQ